MDNPVTQASLSAERFDLRHPCHTQGRELAVTIGTINEKPFTNIISNQPTILIISNFLKESAFSKSKTSRASHSWEAVNSHVAGRTRTGRLDNLQRSSLVETLLSCPGIFIDLELQVNSFSERGNGGQPPIKLEV